MADSDTNNAPKKRSFLRLFLVIGGGILGGLLWYLHTSGQLAPLAQYLNKETIEALVERAGVFGPVIFILMYYVLALFFVSTAALTILSGVLFGTKLGVLYTVIAATTAAQTGFLLARSLGQGAIERLIARFVRDGALKTFIEKLVASLEAKLEKNGFQTFCIMRCIFIPYMPLSVAAGLTQRGRAWDFFRATFLTNLIVTPAFVFLGDNLLEGPKALLLPVGMIVVVLLIPKIVKKIRGEKDIPAS